MRGEKQFDIHIYKLSNGAHEYDFELKDEFFEMFDGDLLNKGNLTARVVLNKSDSMIQAEFIIEGSIKLECDRSLELFDYPLRVKKDLMFKYGDEDKELSDDVYVIEKNTQTLNVAKVIFEFIGLEVPMKKLHPKFADEDLDEENSFIYTSGEEENDIEQEEEIIDPRWDALKKLKNNK